MFAPIHISRPPSEGLFSPFGFHIPQPISIIPAPPSTTTAAHLRPAPNRNTATRNTTSASTATNTTSQPHHNPHLYWVNTHEPSYIRAKTNIGRFGATWLRSAGCSKTLQAQEDEAAERAEQEEQERRQRGLAEAVAAQEAEERRRRAGGGTDVGGDGAMEGVEVQGQDGQTAGANEDTEALGMERDLDDEVPEGDGQENVDMDEGDEETEEDSEGGDSVDEEAAEQADVTFDEEDTGGDGAMQRNLDSDIPEASGEYEHTDTDIEDDETEEVSISQGLDGTSEVDLRSSTLSRQQQSQQRRSVQRQQSRPQYQQEQRQSARVGNVSAAPRMAGIAMSPGVFTSSPAAAPGELDSSLFGAPEAGFAGGSPAMGMMRPPGAPRRR